MEEKTGVLICVGAAVAANCVPCFRHYHAEALRLGLSPSEIDAAVALGSKVKTGANIAVMSAVTEATRSSDRQSAQCDETATPACCARLD